MLRGGAFSDEIGTLHCSVVKQDARSTQVDLDEGFYWFGAKGTDPDGRPFGSVGTGLVRVEAGDHKVRFVLAPAVAIEGRLVGEDVLRLQAGIARRGGLELDVGGEGLFPFRPVGADGSFAFAAVPVGENEIWIGTATELAAGKPARRQALTVEAKGVPFLEIAVR
jgi:hypothetical protein